MRHIHVYTSEKRARLNFRPSAIFQVDTDTENKQEETKPAVSERQQDDVSAGDGDVISKVRSALCLQTYTYTLNCSTLRLNAGGARAG